MRRTTNLTILAALGAAALLLGPAHAEDPPAGP